VNTNSSLITELLDKSYRDAYVASQIRIGLPFQIRALRVSRGWTQAELAKRAEMSQPRIAEIEKGKRSLNIETLLRLASAFDIGLDVFFTSFGDLVDHKESFQPDSFRVLSFTDEIAATQRLAKNQNAETTSVITYNVDTVAGVATMTVLWVEGLGDLSASLGTAPPNLSAQTVPTNKGETLLNVAHQPSQAA
jgi:HTH-type transcriptional regulator/antitoxin HipB